MTEVASPGPRQLRLLVVEDSERDARLVVAAIEAAGYSITCERVETAGAMTAALRSPWDLVISDFAVPGFGAAGALAVLAESGVDLPFIVVSGTEGEEVAVGCMRAGAHDFFLKGKLARLPAAIERELHQAEHRRFERSMSRALEAVRDMAHAVAAPSDAERLALFAAGRARELLRADAAGVYGWDEGDRLLRLLGGRVDGIPTRARVLAPGEGLSGAAFERGEPVLIADYAQPPAGIRPPVPGLTGSGIAVPLIAGGRKFGALYIRSHQGRAYGDEDVRALQLLGAQVAPALASVQLFEEACQRALHDPLTGLPNRASLRSALEREIRSGDGPCAVLLADLDSFRAVNEGLGRDAGDEVLRQAAARLRSGVGPRSMPAHLGEDEFGVLLRGRDAAGALASAERMVRGLDKPFSVNGQTVAIAVSIGVAAAPEHGDDAEVLLLHAETAMRSAKRTGATFASYSPSLEEHTREQLELVGHLRRAIDDGELVLHYQRQVELSRMRTSGYEALARWQHPTRGLLLPAAFLPLAERSGLSREVFAWSLRTALREAVEAGFGEDRTVTVNISVRNLLDAELPAMVEGALISAGRPAHSLVLEITEQDTMVDPERTIHILQDLHAIGVRISIDDFGTGHSSMAYVQRLPVHELKVDRSFLRGLPADERSIAIVRATIDLAKGLGLVAVAEGVEDEATLAVLVRLGCERAQGYHLGRPMEATQAVSQAG